MDNMAYLELRFGIWESDSIPSFAENSENFQRAQWPRYNKTKIKGIDVKARVLGVKRFVHSYALQNGYDEYPKSICAHHIN